MKQQSPRAAQRDGRELANQLDHPLVVGGQVDPAPLIRQDAGGQARWRSSRSRISSSTALGRVVSKSISFAHVGVTTIRTMPSW